MTQRPTARPMKVVAPLVLGLTLAGCVSLTTPQQQNLDEIQRLADRTTAIYRLPSVRISVQRGTNLNIGGVYRQGNIFLNVRSLDSPGLTKLIAHELGHYVLGHDRLTGRMESCPGAAGAGRQRQSRRDTGASAGTHRDRSPPDRRGRATSVSRRAGAWGSTHSGTPPCQCRARGRLGSFSGLRGAAPLAAAESVSTVDSMKSPIAG
jgi:hypothetical protein